MDFLHSCTCFCSSRTHLIYSLNHPPSMLKVARYSRSHCKYLTSFSNAQCTWRILRLNSRTWSSKNSTFGSSSRLWLWFLLSSQTFYSSSLETAAKKYFHIASKVLMRPILNRTTFQRWELSSWSTSLRNQLTMYWSTCSLSQVSTWDLSMSWARRSYSCLISSSACNVPNYFAC